MTGTVLLGAALIVSAFAFGVLLKLSDLLQEHGYTWFSRADLVVGSLSTIPALAMLALADDHLQLLWVAVLLTWLVRGRVDGVNHGVPVTAMALFLLWTGPEVRAHLGELGYFFGILATLGLLHDFLQYTEAGGPRWLRWLMEMQHLYWYGTALLFQVVFEVNVMLLVGVYGFTKGYGFLYQERFLRHLPRLGICRPAAGAGAE